LVRAIQPASFGARSIAGLEPDGKAAIVLASREPLEQHVWRVPLDGSTPLALTEGGGVHEAISDHGISVITSALRDGGTTVRAMSAARASHTLPTLAERPALVPTTKIETVELEGRKHYAAITRPQRFDKSRRYPVLLRVYGGPGRQNVLDVRDSYLLDQWYADAGFIVIRADGRGTPHRGRSWERVILRDLLTIPLNDQVAALDALAQRHAELDRTRVGVFGWSFGGYLSVLATMLRPDVFRAAVAGAPVTDWTLYDTAYTERFMKLPADNGERYRHTSALTHAGRLERPLLIMHGMTDDNVHFAHSTALIDALFRAGKRAEVVALSSTHMVTDPKLTLAREKVQVDFFRDHLGNRP
jgi:dipeptidyl-peptidase-4